ncbi:unnamed protein product [Tuber aestivum]|uniref:Uncharacterized protein n=1 Tax=Tuber aestivum TaxID=59557 RepID=A0A292Q5N3_9PEZI|nr:unnamed protein product [Tuber aestivum]
MVPGVEPSKKHDVVETKVQIIAFPKQTSGKMEVCGAILRDGRPTTEAIPQSQYRGTYTDHGNILTKDREANPSAYGFEQRCFSLSLKGVVPPP